jgi:outer membrane protein TolC
MNLLWSLLPSLIAWLALCTGARAATEPTMNLVQCLNAAVDSSEDVRSQRRIWENNQRSHLTAWSGLLPRLDFNLSRTFQQNDPSLTLLVPGTVNALTSSLTLTEVLYDNHLTINQIERTGALSERYRLNYLATRNNLLFDVIQAYFNLASSYRLDQISQEEIDVAKKEVALAEAVYRVGHTPKSDVLKAQVQLQATIAKKIRTRNDFTIGKAKLLSLLAVEPQVISIPIENAADPLPFQLDKDGETLPEGTCQTYPEEVRTAEMNRPELLETESEINVAEADLNDSWRALLPRLDVRGTYQWVNSAPDQNFMSPYLTEGQASANLTWTIWDWGTNYRGVQSSRALRDNAEDQRALLRRQVALELQTACLDLSARRNEFETNRLRVDLSKENLAKAEGIYRVGKDNLESVFLATRDYIQALQDKVSAYYSFMIAQAQKEKANGTIDRRLDHKTTP